MRIYDIIAKKRDGKELSSEEIGFFIEGYTCGDVEDYHMSALLMAIYLNGMTDDETYALTNSMVESGDVMDLFSISGVKVDKHSTGGVGDKTTLIISPIVAACGVKVAKMSGRGLGCTGGTIDKLESIPGFCTVLETEKFIKTVNSVGFSIVSQTKNLVPADKKIYALRDVTATVDSIPLIASSIMSKKIASGADYILLDVKTGSGAFIKEKSETIKFAKTMISIGEKAGKKVSAFITNMDIPLGNAVGNFLEIIEVCEILQGRGPQDLKEISVCLAAEMLHLAGKGNFEECEKMVIESIDSGAAFAKFKEMVVAQGGDTCVLDSPQKYLKSECSFDVISDKDGYINSMNTEKCGIAAMILGAGRAKKDDCIDYHAGIIFAKKTGDYVYSGDVIATLYSSDIKKCEQAAHILRESIVIGESWVELEPLVQARISSKGVVNLSGT